MKEHLRLGVSACLLGHPVRYDGNHKRDPHTIALARLFDLVPVCPEVAAGMTVPRPPIRLEGDASAPRAVGVENKALDMTIPLRLYGQQAAHELRDICGFVFKSRSPSCGLQVQVHPAGVGRGIFARELMNTFPLLPVIDELQLADPQQRKQFIAQVLAYEQSCEP